MSERDVLFLDTDPTSGLPVYSGDEYRFALQLGQEGVFAPTDLLVQSGGGLTVEVGLGRGLVDSGTPTGQSGFRYGIFNDATVNSAAFEAGGIPANASVNPRLDAVIARVWDHTQDGSGF